MATQTITPKRNPGVTTNALYKSSDSFNCNLTPSQAIELARNLLHKAQQILDRETEMTAVQLWNRGADNEFLSCGLIEARKGARRKSQRRQ